MKLKYSLGNYKIGRDTMIINMGTAIDCPSLKKGLCQLEDPLKECYAIKAERQYPSVTPHRTDQKIIWKRTPVKEIASQIWSIQARKRKKLRYLRLNESGDFWGQRCIKKASELASLLEPIGIKVYTYTSRKDLDFKGLHRNITITGSGFMIHNSFNVVKEIPKNGIECPGDCRTCHICKESRNVKVYIKKH